MRTVINLFILAALAGLVSAGFAQETPASPGAAISESGGVPSFPYMAEITGDDVYIRSGPGTNFYQCGKLSKGDRVKILRRQYSWSCAVPPDGSFSWISMRYVDIDPGDPSMGIVNGDGVRVYAGSDYVKPLYSTTLQGKLNQGEKVKLLGEQMDDYYKIAPPSFAYLWISTVFTNPISPTASEIVELPAVEPPPVESPRVEPVTEPDAISTVVPTTSPVDTDAKLKEYYTLKEQIETEHAKPVDQQDYTKIKEALTKIAEDKEAGKAGRYAEFVLRQVEGFELALAVGKEIQLAGEQLQQTKERIDKARATRLAEIKDLGRFAVIGKLQTSAIYGSGRYRIVNESGSTICYALPSGQTAQTDLSSLVGHKVGLVGVLVPHQQTAGALVRFTEIVDLD